MQHFIKEFNSLGLLPGPDIEDAFQGLAARAPVEFPEHAEQLVDFCGYWERFWLRQIGPDFLSVYNLDDRTNNVLESYHAVLKHILGSKAPWWPIMEHLRNSFRLWQVDFDAIRKGNLKKDPGSKRRRSRQKLIQRFMRELGDGTLSVVDFLHKTA